MSNNSEVIIAPYTKKNIFLRLINNDAFNKWDKIFIKLGACRNNSNDDAGWIISKDKQDLVEDALYRETKKQSTKNSKEEEVEEGDDEESEESDDYSDDELIQEVLSKKIKSESDHKVIDDNNVDDSDYEDIISVSRRLRNIYNRLNKLDINIQKINDMLANKECNIPLAVPIDRNE